MYSNCVRFYSSVILIQHTAIQTIVHNTIIEVIDVIVGFKYLLYVLIFGCAYSLLSLDKVSPGYNLYVTSSL